MRDPACGGCRGEGAHRRWCPAVVGLSASIYGPMAEELETMGDRIGSNNPGLANGAYALSSRVRAWAQELADTARRGQE